MGIQSKGSRDFGRRRKKGSQHKGEALGKNRRDPFPMMNEVFAGLKPQTTV